MTDAIADRFPTVVAASEGLRRIALDRDAIELPLQSGTCDEFRSSEYEYEVSGRDLWDYTAYF
jgi:hypothetical protein